MTQGIKFDGDKPRLAEMIIDFREPLLALCEVWEFGANKYGESNWKHLENGEARYMSALFRHYFAIADNDYDDESRLLHCAHIIFNAMAYAYFVKRRLENRSLINEGTTNC